MNHRLTGRSSQMPAGSGGSDWGLDTRAEAETACNPPVTARETAQMSSGPILTWHRGGQP